MAIRRIPWLLLELDTQVVLVSDFHGYSAYPLTPSRARHTCAGIRLSTFVFPLPFCGCVIPLPIHTTKTINGVSGEGNGEDSMGNALGKGGPSELVWAAAVPAGESVSDGLDTANG